MSVGVRSVRWQVLNMFKTFHRTERTKASVTCTLGVRWFPFCPVLVRYIFGSCPLRFRWCPVDSSHGRTTTGRGTDKRRYNGRVPDANGGETHRYRYPFLQCCIRFILHFQGKYPWTTAHSSSNPLPMPLSKHFKFCLWWESFFNGGHFSTCQTRKKSTPVTFFLHMRHVFLRPGAMRISLRRKMTPRSIFDGDRYSSLHLYRQPFF